MAERVFCIDLGSAYTKVALRRDPTADGELIEPEYVGTGFLVPSTLVIDRRSKTRVLFGDEAEGQVSGGGIEVVEDWKRTLFLPPPPADERPALDTLLDSDELRELGAKYQVSDAQLAHLRALVAAARGVSGGSAPQPGAAGARQQARAAALAAHFFDWLKKLVLSACAKLSTTGLKFEDIPVRVTVPAFGPADDPTNHPGCELLRKALAAARWPLHADRPFVTEPESNAVGVLTRAANVLDRRQKISLRDMFNKGPLITVLKGDAHHPSYRAVVIDVGAFTTDLAALYTQPGGKPLPESGVGFEVAQKSVPVGVRALDDAMKAALNAPDWPARLSGKEWATFQRNVYTEGKGYRMPGYRTVGGTADQDAVQSCLAEFGQRIAAEVTSFTAAFTPASMQELILTGGGTAIPAVRTAILGALQEGGAAFVKTHAPDLKRAEAASPLVDKIGTALTRGGSALGGTSIYFEKGYY